MAEYGHQGGRRVDAYGNPIPEVYNATGAGTGAHGTTGVGPYGTAHPQGGVAAAGGGGHGQLMPGRERGHRRSGSSSSSSSSEDDGMGGRRKKGIKEKIKEKMPGAHKTADDEHRYAGQTAPMTTATAPPTAAEGGRGRKGMMEKIKEKLPGGGH
uniref:Dehydrin Rab15 n=1 Tax=Ananas comosus var. bracteatus TaxID=296719 RepID=A0A6V7PW18_ANACO|nr:unnamed protein product [Ananas comosus var. bracteatus]